MNKFFTSSLLSLTFIFSSAQLLADYASRMKERLPSLLEAKDLGVIGEGTDGFVYIREGDSEKIKIVTSENEDRKILFNTMATKTGGSIDEVANRFSKALVQKSKKGHWFRKSSGEWMQRK